MSTNGINHLTGAAQSLVLTNENIPLPGCVYYERPFCLCQSDSRVESEQDQQDQDEHSCGQEPEPSRCVHIASYQLTRTVRTPDPPNLRMGSQYRSMSLVVLPHQSTSFTLTLREPLVTVTVSPRHPEPIARRNFKQAAATMDPGG